MRFVFFLYGFVSVVYATCFWRYQMNPDGGAWACETSQFWDEISWGWIEMENNSK